MRKIAVVFMVAVFAPSLVLAWMAVRSARDQQIVVAQQQTLLFQGVADALAGDVRGFIGERQREFAQIVEALRRDRSPADLAARFDHVLRERWAYAEVGFTVGGDGSVLSPSLFERAEARQFRLNNDRFLGSCESVEVYWNSPKGAINLSRLDAREPGGEPPVSKQAPPDVPRKTKFAMVREEEPAVSDPPARLAPETAEFKQLVGDAFEGTVARYLENKLKVLLWYRSAREPDLIYGAQLNLPHLVAQVAPLVRAPESVRENVSVALLNDAGRAVAGAPVAGRPCVSGDIGPALPHWRIGVFVENPEALTRSARTLTWMFVLLAVVMLLAIGIGSALIAADLHRQVTLARQKTDFVSNVSHELKTPLTSIRMFSELLAENRVSGEDQRRQFLQIISTETARLTRLINNVLDFARIDRGEKSYQLVRCDLAELVRDTTGLYRPQLEAAGLALLVTVPDRPVPVNGDKDALAQVLVNLLSNAEKYSGQGREVTVELAVNGATAGVRVLDRGPGVPRGCEERIFEQFFRAHDSLGSGIQGSGLGLTLARQIARAHGGDVCHEAREGGGSCFNLRLPLAG
jgi:signal transduction histidine kinase